MQHYSLGIKMGLGANRGINKINSATYSHKARAYTLVLSLCLVIFAAACNQPDSTSTAAISKITSSSSTSSSTTATPIPNTTSSTMAFQIITQADANGSFNNIAIPVSGGIAAKAQRLYNLDGSLISSINVPTWFSEAGVFLTSTRTSAGAATNVTSDTACAYFDSYTTDNNAETTGYYTIDGYNASAPGVATDIDQCAGTAAAEQNKLGLYVKLDRLFMNSTDKIQVIVKLKPIDEPNTAPTASSCVVGGFFDAGNCSNLYYTVSMRTAPYAATKPFYVLFPSAKALDLLSETVLLPLNINSGITTISIDRVKGGAIFYGVTIVRIN